MKNNLFFLSLLLLLGCTSNTIVSTKASCPNVFFSANHKTYISTDNQQITTDNINYKADINNYAFNSGCYVRNQIIHGELSLLFVIKPIQTKINEIELPFYVAVLNEKDELLDIQYYLASGDLKTNSEDKNYIETELTKNVTFYIPNTNNLNQKNILILGFMLDRKKIDILN